VSTRAVVRLGHRCNNACVFCGQAGVDDDTPLPFEPALRAAAGVHREVTFVGGEPTLDPRLPDAVALARSLGFEAIGVQTNGRGLDVAGLVARGLSDVHLSIHGATAPVHDYHTQIEGSFAALASALPGSITTVVSTVVTRSNYRVLSELAGWLHDRGVAAWLLAVPHVAGGAASAFDRIVPRLGLALPYVLHAASRATALGLRTAIAGAPLCALGPHARLALRDETRRAYAPTCDACPARARCVGVDAAYLARFTAEELRPVDAPPESSALPPHHARMFVGPGTLVPATVAPHPPPADARRHLPLLGRPRAAVTEVRGHTPSRDARELFPQLFEDES
jgi:hypothetical protein